jgi:hypothetical protein
MRATGMRAAYMMLKQELLTTTALPAIRNPERFRVGPFQALVPDLIQLREVVNALHATLALGGSEPCRI